jgi:hypothetical protein
MIYDSDPEKLLRTYPVSDANYKDAKATLEAELVELKS